MQFCGFPFRIDQGDGTRSGYLGGADVDIYIVLLHQKTHTSSETIGYLAAALDSHTVIEVEIFERESKIFATFT
jgi:hypothetical protein